jgi:hypothetical protein
MHAEDPQDFWADVLSGEAPRIRAALESLEPATRQAVLAHLRRMAEEPGWTEGQQRRALAALNAATPGLGESPPPTEDPA